MDFLDGRSLRDSLRAKVASYDAYPLLLRVPMLLALRRKTKRQLTTLLEAQAEQVFRLGTFNADPHPGNIFLVPTGGLRAGGGVGGERLGLLDFGCAKTLSRTQRLNLARLYVALRRGDDGAIIDAAVAMGVRTKVRTPCRLAFV